MQEKQPFTKRVIEPAAAASGALVLSAAFYYLSRRLDNQLAHQALAAVFGTTFFLSVAVGGFFVYRTARLRGASFAERVIAACATPFLWATGSAARLYESHTVLECLYWYLNPLNIWLAAFLVLEMGLAEMWTRKTLNNRDGTTLKAATPGTIAAVSLSFVFIVFCYAWGQGENLYVIFLEGYRHLFGSGI